MLKLQACIHPTVMKDMCAECGADLRMEQTETTASVPMVHSIPDLKVSEEVCKYIIINFLYKKCVVTKKKKITDSTETWKS